MMLGFACHQFALVKKRGPKHQRQFLRPVFAQPVRCMWVLEVFTPVKQYNLPIDPVSICGSGCFSQSPQVIYFKIVGLNVWRKLKLSVCRIHVHTAFENGKCQWVSMVMTYKRSLLKYCILGWLTSCFNLEIGPTPSTHAQTHAHSQLEVNEK